MKRKTASGTVPVFIAFAAFALISSIAHAQQSQSPQAIDTRIGAPAVFEKNWIPTVPGRNWFAYFRFYQPTEAYFDRSWPLADFEEIR